MRQPVLRVVAGALRPDRVVDRRRGDLHGVGAERDLAQPHGAAGNGEPTASGDQAW